MDRLRPRTARQRAALALMAYFACGSITLAMAHTIGGAPPGLGIPVAAVFAGVVVPLALWRAREARLPASRVLEVLFVLLTAASLVAIWRGTLPSRPYGDGSILVEFLRTGYVFPRWLVGMYAALSAYSGVWQFPPIAARLPVNVAGPETFAALLCTVVMGASSIAVLRQWPDRLSVAFATLTPVWILFASGYVEYYPLMIGPWVAVLAWLFDQPLERRPVALLGAVMGVLPAVYIGFAPLALVVLVIVAIKRPGATLVLLASSAAAFALAVSVCTYGLPQFFRQLYAEMNFGEEHVGFLRYIGRSAGPASIFFTSRYVFARSHLRDLAYMTFWGAGWLLPVLLVCGFVAHVVRRVEAAALRDARTWLGGVLIVWQVYYLLFMIPKKGPTGDVDLFCPTYTAIAFVGGLLLDQLGADECWWRVPVLSAVAGVAVGTAVFLAGLGLPQRL